MSEDQNVVPLKSPAARAAEEIKTQIVAVAAGANEQDRRMVNDLIAAAIASKWGQTASPTFSPAAAAIIFLEHNPHNRDWHPLRSQELARQMKDGQWKRNNATIGFYEDGHLSDGQHRLGGTALSGVSLSSLVAFGQDRDAIVTVDVGVKRAASDAVKLEGVADAVRKQTIIKMAASYRVRSGEKAAALKSETEVAAALRTNNDLLIRAIDIGERSTRNSVNAILKETQASAIAYLMLGSNWPESRVREKLAVFQTGHTEDGEKTPYFVAGEMISRSRKRREDRDRLSTVKELGVVMYAMVSTERGVKAVRESVISNAIKSKLPDPAFPMTEAASVA